jgi:heat shock protein HslJ
MFTRNSYILIMLLGTLTLVVSACAATGGQAEVSIEDLENTRWELVSYGDIGLEVPVVEDSTVTLEIQPGGQIGGTGGCNSYGGEATLEDGKLTIGEITSTLMACMDEAVMEQEQQFFMALNSASKVELNGNALTILYNDGKSALHFMAAPEAAVD